MGTFAVLFRSFYQTSSLVTWLLWMSVTTGLQLHPSLKTCSSPTKAASPRNVWRLSYYPWAWLVANLQQYRSPVPLPPNGTIPWGHPCPRTSHKIGLRLNCSWAYILSASPMPCLPCSLSYKVSLRVFALNLLYQPLNPASNLRQVSLQSAFHILSYMLKR